MLGLLLLTWVVTSFAAVFHLLIHKREPPATLAWIFFVICVPAAGPFLYVVFGPQRLERKAIERKTEINEALESSAFSHALVQGSGPQPEPLLGESERRVLELARRVSDYRATSGNQIELLGDPGDALKRMQAAIRSARHFIHLEYYIIESDEVTEQLFDSLIEARQRGVEVRILYDSFGSLSLKRVYFRNLTKHGVKTAGFLPFSFAPLRLHINFRNHRKILIIDGTLAFTGGTNIGKQYLGSHHDSLWRDYTVRVEGPACLQLEDVFAKDWHFTTQEDLFQASYYPAVRSVGDTIVQVLESGPDSQFQALLQAIFLAVNEAKKEILLTTPYFVPDRALLTALTVASLQGTRVRIILPAKSDANLVRIAGRSFYEELLGAGIEVFEFQPRILHSKLLSLDSVWTILGSANMDTRSFRLNFELNLLVHGASVAKQAETIFAADLAQSKEIVLAEHLRRSLGTRIQENICRLLSPIL